MLMSKNNGIHKKIHVDNLKPSSQDCIALAEAIEPRFLTIVELYGKKWGGQLIPIPKEIQGHITRWRQMLLRHRKRDFRNSLSEWQSTKQFAQWTVDRNCELRGQEPKKVDFGE
jgi:hypothetical protein